MGKANKYDHPEWLKFSHFWRPVLWYTASCFERDCLRDCKNLLWERWAWHSEGQRDFPGDVEFEPEFRHREWPLFEKFWSKALATVSRESNGERGVWVLTSVKAHLWARWKIRAAAVERMRRGTGS